MEDLFSRLILIGAVTVIALHFPELLSWDRLLRNKKESGDPRLKTIHLNLRILLRIVFFFYIVLLAYTLHQPIPSKILIYPLILFHLAGLIIGERDLITELSVNDKLRSFVFFLVITELLEIGLLTIVALQMHGLVTI
jgi:hypothetical protein